MRLRELREQIASAHRVLSEKLDVSGMAVEEARAIARRLAAYNHYREPYWPDEETRVKEERNALKGTS